MLIKNGQLKIKTINGKIVAKPDLKTAAGNGVVRKYKVAEKGIRYRKIYETKEARYMYFMTDVAEFAASSSTQIPVEKKKIDKSAVVLAGLQGAATGLGAGFIGGEILSYKKPSKTNKYKTIAALGTGSVVGSLAAYQKLREQKRKDANI